MKYADTLKNRFKAIESLVSLDEAFEIDCAVAFHPEKLSKKKLVSLLKLADKVIIDTYHLTHGFSSKCCKGKGANLIEPLIKRYFE